MPLAAQRLSLRQSSDRLPGPVFERACCQACAFPSLRTTEQPSEPGIAGNVSVPGFPAQMSLRRLRPTKLDRLLGETFRQDRCQRLMTIHETLRPTIA